MSKRKWNGLKATPKLVKILAVAALLFTSVGIAKDSITGLGSRIVAKEMPSLFFATQNPGAPLASNKKIWKDGFIWYKNTKYGARVKLPKSWEGYKVTIDQWQGGGTDAKGKQIQDQGPKILIQHPKSTEENPRQDIPLMFSPWRNGKRWTTSSSW